MHYSPITCIVRLFPHFMGWSKGASEAQSSWGVFGLLLVQGSAISLALYQSDHLGWVE